MHTDIKLQGGTNHPTKSILTRKRDIVIRIADWSRDKDEPAFDVEVYVRGEYRGDLSYSATFRKHGNKPNARQAAKAAVHKILSLV